MKKPALSGQLGVSLVCVLVLVVLIVLAPGLVGQTNASDVPGLSVPTRTLLRLWLINAPGGAQQWLTAQLQKWEQQHPGCATYLRSVTPSALTDDDAVLPDIVLYMPGDVETPDTLFMPLGGNAVDREGILHPALKRAGRWQNTQYGLPLCWGAWALAINSSLEPGSALTPAPATLLGKPAATLKPQPSTTPDFPLQAALESASPLQSSGGAALFTLGLLLKDLARLPLPNDFAQLSPAAVYDGFRQQKWPAAMLTTGQITALTALTSGGNSFAFRIMTPQEIITDQVLMASITPGAPAEAAQLLAYLTASTAQEALASQGLHTVLENLALYPAGVSAQIEQAAHFSLSVVNAYLPDENLLQAGWQFLQGVPLDSTLLPLL